MIITFNFHALCKDEKVNKSKIARRIGVTPQLLHHHFTKGEVPSGYLWNIAEELDITVSELCQKLEQKYVKRRL
jgi:DNA-binding Xre family transcriptional regulator